MVRKRGKRGSSMGTSTQKSRTGRKTGKRYLTIPDKWMMYKEEADTTVKMDILPYIVNDVELHPEGKNMEDDVWYRFPYLIHRNIGPSKAAVLCPGTIGRPCPICDKRKEIFDDPDLDNKMAGKLKQSPRSLFIIKIINDGNDKNKGKQFIWDVSDFCFFDQVDTELEHGEEEWNDFACLEGGYTLKVRILEDSFDTTKFPKADRIDFIERSKDYPESILDDLPCLDDVIIPNIKTYEEIEAILEGMHDGDDDTDDEEDDEKPKKSSRAKKMAGSGKTTKSKVSDDDDTDDEEDAEADDNERKRPKRSSKTKPAPKTKKKPEVTWEELEELGEEELVDLVQERDLEIDDDEWDDEDGLRETIASMLDIKIPDDDDEDDADTDDEEDEEKPSKPAPKKPAPKKPAPTKSTQKKKPTGKTGGQCPHGYKFGEEFGDYEECNEDDCPKHDACFDKYDELNDNE